MVINHRGGNRAGMELSLISSRSQEHLLPKSGEGQPDVVCGLRPKETTPTASDLAGHGGPTAVEMKLITCEFPFIITS
jgi:hypothetical protein